jgi:hypothetical protein
LTEAFDGNDQGAEAVFGNVRALSGVLDLFGENAEGTMEILKEMTDDLGVLDEAFAITEDTVGFKAAKAFETFKSIMLDIGDAVLPLVVDVLDELLPFIQDATVRVKEFIDTKLGPFIDGLKSNTDFQNFLSTMKDLFFDIVPKVIDFAKEVSILATNLTTLLKPAIDQFIGPGGSLSSFMRIVQSINFWLGELNKIQIPGFDGELNDLWKTIGNILPPTMNFANTLGRIADGLDAIRLAYERVKKSGFSAGLFGTFGGTGGLGETNPSSSGGGGGRATGGSVMGGVGYLVGERGPEIFMPAGSGTIVPNHRLGGGSTVNIVVNAGMGADGAEVGRKVVDAIRAYERRSGKVFAAA